MSFTRVEQDGVEFYTLTSNGASGMSIAGLARLCDVNHSAIRQLLQRTHGSKVTSKWLKPLIEGDVYLAVSPVSGARILKAEVCTAIIGYFAFASRNKTKAAEYAFAKFAYMGMEHWIQSYTGWQGLPPATELTEEAVIAYISDRLEPGMIPIGIKTESLTEMLKRGDFTGSGCRLYFYLEMMHLQGKTPSERQICEDLKISSSTLRKWLPKIHDWSHCADWLQLQGRKGPEYAIQLRMHKALGGVMEAFTVAGRIDLVTDTEVIEIKRVADWKDAVGEVMVKGQSFPNHQKRIHLFGQVEKLRETILATCTSLDITVTIEPAPALSIVPNPAPLGNAV